MKRSRSKGFSSVDGCEPVHLLESDGRNNLEKAMRGEKMLGDWKERGSRIFEMRTGRRVSQIVLFVGYKICYLFGSLWDWLTFKSWTK